MSSNAPKAASSRSKTENLVALQETAYGFRWHHVSVERSASVDIKRGKYLSLTLKTDREWLQVDVTPSGLFRTKSLGKVG